MRGIIVLLVLFGFGLTGCKDVKDLDTVLVISNKSSQGTATKAGPPPHAPAHGYRYKHANGTELVFDSGLGVYVVMDMSDVFFYNELYIRYQQDTWQVAVKLDSPWRIAKKNEVPVKLKNAKKNKHPKGHGNGKAKGHGKHQG
jgi:hypothetical protein